MPCSKLKYLNIDQALLLGNYVVSKRFAVQTFLWSLEFVIQINIELDTTAEINLIFPIKLFFYMIKLSRQEFKYTENKRAFKVK